MSIPEGHKTISRHCRRRSTITMSLSWNAQTPQESRCTLSVQRTKQTVRSSSLHLPSCLTGIRMTNSTHQVYDVLVHSLKRSHNSHAEKWVRNIRATSIVEAGEIAKAKHPNLGITPTQVSMIWPQYPQPKQSSITERKP